MLKKKIVNSIHAVKEKKVFKSLDEIHDIIKDGCIIYYLKDVDGGFEMSFTKFEKEPTKEEIIAKWKEYDGGKILSVLFANNFLIPRGFGNYEIKRSYQLARFIGDKPDEVGEMILNELDRRVPERQYMNLVSEIKRYQYQKALTKRIRNSKKKK